ncbi:general stress protein [Cryptosporangium arvum]|uniref:general stress protein n=1 Tax=Cryptosporangium arvum TaxID=80871 RepID=UPI0004ACB3E6|nr:general stress protein [Cryptosporangium arvum]
MTIPVGPAAGPPVSANDVDRTLLASYGDYLSAQRAVDYLSDQKFPVEHTTIIGSDLRLVEQVIGRMTFGKAAAAGAGSGAWFGLFFGLLLGLFSDDSFGSWIALILTAVAIGAVWGAIFGLVAHSLTGGQRDFASRSSLAAGRYDVLVSSAHLSDAQRLLEGLQ